MCGIVNSLVGPLLNSAITAVPRQKLILHISVALCFRPSGTGCWVLLKCSQFKTCVFESKLEFIFSSCGKCLYQSCLSMTVWVHSYGDTRRYEAKAILFSMQSQARAVYRGRRNCAIVRQFLASWLAHCTEAAAASMTTTVKCTWWNWGLCTNPGICPYNRNPNLRLWSSDSYTVV